jgi:replication-associated recombination protein RarA
VPFVKAACEQSRAWYDTKKLGKARMPLANAIMMMCRAAKSREADHFQAAIGLASLLEGAVPELPDWIDDQHTYRGRQLKRGLDYFRKVSTVLYPEPTRADSYIDEAYRLWALKSAQAIEADAQQDLLP